MKLIRYIQGTRKGKEAHHVERDALVDPFLAEALEGFESVDGNHIERIERMRQQLTIRSQKKHRSPAVWIAAAVLLLLVTTGGYFWLVKEQAEPPQMAVATDNTSILKEDAYEEDKKIAQDFITEIEEQQSDISLSQRTQTSKGNHSVSKPTPTIPPASIPVVSEILAVVDEELILSELEVSNFNGLENRLVLGSMLDSFLDINLTKKEMATTGDLLASKDISKQNTDIAAVQSSMSKLAHGSNIGNHDPNALSQWQISSQGKIGGKLADQSGSGFSRVGRKKSKAAPSSSSSSYNPPSLPSGNVKGRVIDQNGEPLPFATVQVKGSTAATTTDMDGYFALNAKNAEKLVASSIGFDEVELAADTSKTMTIAMNESTAHLDEMVVVGYGRNRTDDLYSNYESLNTPKPEAGYTAYRKYLSDSMIKPTDECANATGRVVLSFYVSSSGQPYCIEVKKSLCPSADREAIRLVESGGRWTTGNGQVRLTVKF